MEPPFVIGCCSTRRARRAGPPCQILTHCRALAPGGGRYVAPRHIAVCHGGCGYSHVLIVHAGPTFFWRKFGRIVRRRWWISQFGRIKFGWRFFRRPQFCRVEWARVGDPRVEREDRLVSLHSGSEWWHTGWKRTTGQEGLLLISAPSFPKGNSETCRRVTRSDLRKKSVPGVSCRQGGVQADSRFERGDLLAARILEWRTLHSTDAVFG
jgi:hypothetical protein